jgi:hypothetical protein
MIELDDAVDRGLEHGPQAFLGLPQGFVRTPEAGERLVRFGERDLLLVEGVVGLARRGRPSDLVDEDAQGHGDGEHGDERRPLTDLEPLRRFGPGDEGERRARRRHREGREHRAPVPGRHGRPLPCAVAWDHVHQQREHERRERQR